MRTSSLALVSLGIILVAPGCGSKSNPESALQQAAAALEDKTPVSAAPVAGPPPHPGAALPPPTSTSAPAASPAAAPTELMNQAIAAYKSGQLEDAVTRLQRLRATPALTPQQRIAINDAIAAVMGEIYAMAAQGDPRAIQAVKQYERMQTQRP